MYADLYGLRHTIIRLGNPYGERQSPTRRQGAVAVFLDRVSSGEPLDIFGDGSTIRDFIYVKDATRAIRLLLDSDSPDGVYNVGTATGTSLNELVEHIRRVTGRPVEVRKGPGRTVDVPANILNIAKIERVTGWRPECSLADGIARTWDRLRIAALE